jgi:hypothetical protein
MARHRASTLVAEKGNSSQCFTLGGLNGGLHLLDVKIARREAQSVQCVADCLPIFGEDSSGKSILSGAVDELENLRSILVVIVHVETHERAKDLLLHESRLWISRLHNSWADVISSRVIAISAGQNRNVLVFVGIFDVFGHPVIRRPADNGAREVCELVTLSESFCLFDNRLLELFGPRIWYVDTRKCTTLLSLVLVGGADRLESRILYIGRWMNQMEVLSTCDYMSISLFSVLKGGFRWAFTCLTDDSRIRLPEIHLRTNSGRKALEDCCGTCEVQSTQISALEDLACHHLGITREELDNTRRKTSFEHDVIEEPAGVDGAWTGLPNHYVSHNQGRDDQIDGQCSEVERSDGVDEAVQWSHLCATLRELLDARPSPEIRQGNLNLLPNPRSVEGRLVLVQNLS